MKGPGTYSPKDNQIHGVELPQSFGGRSKHIIQTDKLPSFKPLNRDKELERYLTHHTKGNTDNQSFRHSRAIVLKRQLSRTVLLKKFSVESHITVGFSAFLSRIGM